MMDTNALLRDLLEGRKDILAAASEQGLSPAQFADWLAQPTTHRLIAGVRQIVDTQAQLMITRSRLFAVNRLLQFAQGEGETARKACVDLLKLELKHAPAPQRPTKAQADDAAALEAKHRDAEPAAPTAPPAQPASEPRTNPPSNGKSANESAQPDDGAKPSDPRGAKADDKLTDAGRCADARSAPVASAYMNARAEHTHRNGAAAKPNAMKRMVT